MAIETTTSCQLVKNFLVCADVFGRHSKLYSLRSKRFCGFSEHRKTEERDFDNFATGEMGAKKWSVGEGGKE